MVEITHIVKTLSEPEILKETQKINGVDTEVQYGVKYTLTLTNWQAATRASGKPYKEWSGDTTVVVTKGAIVDQYTNGNKEEVYDLGHVDFVRPEFTYQYAGTSRDVPTVTNPEIDYINKKLTVKFTVADKFFYNPTAEELATNPNANKLTINDLTILIDGESITWATAAEAATEGNTKTVKTLTDEPIIEERTKTITNEDGSTEEVEEDYTVGHTYTLVIENLQQEPIDGFDFSGIVSIGIAGGKIRDVEGYTNLPQTITVGIDVENGSDLPGTEYTMPYLPEGYSWVEGNLDTGLVIEENETGNQFVWVEVPRTAGENGVYKTAGLALDIDQLEANVVETAEGSAERTAAEEALQEAYDKIEDDLREYSNDYKSGRCHR